MAKGVRFQATPVTAAERATWAAARVLEAVDRLARDRQSPALLEALIARRREHRDLEAIAQLTEKGDAIRAGWHRRRKSRLAKPTSTPLP